jgi:hypothetical protein
VIAGNIVDRDRGIEFLKNPLIFGNFCGVAGPINQVAANYHEAGMETIEVRNCEFEVGGFLRKILVVSEHPYLRICKHCEKPRLLLDLCG